MDKHNQISSFKDTFKGKQEEPVDKIYFRQKDEINQYSEAYFKSKHILSSKKWWIKINVCLMRKVEN